MRTVIILRPEPGAGRTAERAAHLGLTIRRRPLFVPRALSWDPPDPAQFDALLMTSAHAARLAGPALSAYRALPAYAVGSATAQAMAAQGLANIDAGDADASTMAARIAADGHGHVLHLAGMTVAPMDAGLLIMHRVAVYAMVGTDPTPLDAPPGSVLLVHSSRAGERLAERVALQPRATLHIVAISAAAATACGDGWASIQAPDRPVDDDMLALARRLCE